MQVAKLKNANASVIAVTSTATLLSSLLTTAAGETQELPLGLNAVMLVVEDGDIRLLADGNTPTASKGVLLKQGGHYKFVGVNVAQIKLIRTGSSNVAVGVLLGTSDQDEAGYAAVNGGTVTLGGALTGVSAGAENDNVLTAPTRRPDAFHAQFNATCSTTPQAVKAATASKKHYITDLLISVDTAGWYTILDGATVICGPYYMPANSVLPRKLETPIPGTLNTALNVDCSGSSGNVTVEIDGYTI